MSSHSVRAAGFLLAALPLADPQEGPGFVIRSVRVFDGAAVHADHDVAVAGGRITAVGTGLSVPDGTREIDGRGRTLLPGLIDAHTHVVDPTMLEQALVFGVTTELDMFMSAQAARGIKHAQAEGLNTNQADLRSAGTLVTAPGGHGTQYGVPIPTITKPEEAPAFVDARIAEGSDYIKIVYESGEAYGMTLATISKETLGAVIEAAHARGKLAVVHISTLEAAMDALELGADGLVHIFFEAKSASKLARLAAERKAFVIPTLTVLESASGVASGAAFADDEDMLPYLYPRAVTNLSIAFPDIDGAKESFAGSKAAVGELHRAGVPILAGSDVPNPGTAHGASLHRELALLVEAGLTPIDALKAATSVPAASFGLDDRGAVRAGLRADLVLVDGDPTTDVNATKNVIAVWKNGIEADRAGFRDAIAKGSGLPAAIGAGARDGLVSDFEDGDLRVAFGAGWSISTDAFLGGQSKAEMTVVDGGANGTGRSMSITGELVTGSAQVWAGAMFSPGDAPMVPVDLSTKKGISFWAKGNGQTYHVMLFLQSQGFTPVMKAFASGSEWKHHRFAFGDFGGTDGSDVMGVYFGGAGFTGELDLTIDELRIE